MTTELSEKALIWLKKEYGDRWEEAHVLHAELSVVEESIESAKQTLIEETDKRRWIFGQLGRLRQEAWRQDESV